MAVFSMKHVLMLVADDLRPQLNKAYGQSQMVTPHLDKLAASSLVFDRAYTNFAICSPSRNSFMSGRVPDKTRVWNFINYFRQSGVDGPDDWLSFPEFFKSQGYVVLGHGKMYHPGKPPNNDEPKSWTQEQAYVPLATTGCPRSGAGERFCPNVGKRGRTDDAAFSDYNTTMSALATLREYANGSKPWFIALGLHFPHQPWATPAWAVEKYPAATELPAARHPNAPTDCPPIAYTAELDGNDVLAADESNPILAATAPRAYRGSFASFLCPNTTSDGVPTWFQQQLRLGYYSAVTHTDWLLGQMVAELDGLGVAATTLVVVTGDHGWQLGEHGEWGKHTNFEPAVQVPLLIRAPWLPQSAGKHTQSFIELVDLYRTVAAAAGLPADAIAADVDGTDSSHLLAEPTALLKEEAYAQYSRCPGDRFWPKTAPGHPADYYNNCEGVPAVNITAMGYSVRTATWRLTEWYAWDGRVCAAKFDAPNLGLELYDHRAAPPPPPGRWSVEDDGLVLDFDATENDNVAAKPEHATLVTQLRAKLRARFDTGAALGCPSDPPEEFAAAAFEEDFDGEGGGAGHAWVLEEVA